MIVKDFNNNINKPFVFLLFWVFKKSFRLLQNYIERHYFPPLSEAVQTAGEQDITPQFKTFYEDWDTKELDIYNFM